MNRRSALKQLTLMSALYLTYNVEAKKKKKKKKEDEKKKEKVEAKKMTGKVILETKGITKSYKFLADKPYTIAKSLIPKIKDYEGQQITLFGTFFQTKVLTITGVLNK